MATIVVVFKILFLVLIAHSFVVQVSHTSSSSASRVATAKDRIQQEANQSTAAAPAVVATTTTTVAKIKRNSDDDDNDNDDVETTAVDGASSQRRLRPTAPVAAAAAATTPQPVNYAELCYLSNGGSSLTLTVNEATQVGSIIGTVEVNGDPSLEGGNVELFDAATASESANSSSSNNNRQQQTTTTTATANGSIHELLANAGGESGAGGGWQRNAQARHLGRRAAALLPPSSQLKESAVLRLITSGEGVAESSTSGGGGNHHHQRYREPKLTSLSPPPPPPQLTPLGLASGGLPEHSASFYSLLAGTSTSASVREPPVASLASGSSGGGGGFQQQPAVRLEPGTKNLILVRPLDKESVEGEQGIVINVRCSPRTQLPNAQSTGGEATASQPVSTQRSAAGAQLSHQRQHHQQQQQQSADSTTIPVRIIVTDANDHAPEFVGAQPYVVNISETTPVGAIVSRDILALDRDSAGPFSTLHYRVLESPQDTGGAGVGVAQHAGSSALLQFSNPLDPTTLMLASPLDYETLGSSFVVTIVAQDQGEPEPLSATAQVLVNIIDFDDQNPRFLDDKYTLIMDETQQNLVGQNLQVLPRNLYAEDGDRGIGAPIVYSFDQIGGGGFQTSPGAADESSGTSPSSSSSSSSSAAATTAAQEEPSLNIERYLHLNPANGEIRLIRQWPSSKQQWLGSPVTLVVRATQADNKDRYSLTTLTIMRPPTAGASVQPSYRSVGQVGSELAAAAATRTAATATVTSGGGGNSQGIEFTPDRLTVSVPESAPINEKIARVRARYSGKELEAGADAVDLVPDLPGASTTSRQQPQAATTTATGNRTTTPLPQSTVARRTTTRLAELQQAAGKRPINYQILDDQTDQFGINGLGEIFIKRPLDYEQRQEYKFRVLATYTKYSDICQVQVNVLNVNDNKPKFTQPQYTFHLTESRLRSNLIGQVSAHDADLNDTVHYSLTGEHAHLFEISPAGQISLRPGIKQQLNMSNCQLLVLATDSLGASHQPPQHHSHQARVNLHIAPQLIGRSVNFEHPADHQQQLEAKLFNARSLVEGGGGGGARDWSPPAQSSQAHGQHHQLTVANSKAEQPAGVSTTSNQRSSVATVMASLQHMVRSVSFLDMPMSSALLLSALLAFLICLLFIVVISMSVHFYRRRTKQLRHHRHHLAATAHIRHAHLAALRGSPAERSRYLQTSVSPPISSSSSSASSSGNSKNLSPSSSSPTDSTTAAGSSTIEAAATTRPKLTAKVAPASKRPASTEGPRDSPTRLSTQTSSRPPTQTERASGGAPSTGSPTGEPSSNGHRDQQRPRPKSQCGGRSLVSSLSSHSKRSYRSNTTDDSSVMRCGHYSISAPLEHSPQPPPLQQHHQQQQLARAASRQSSIEAAIKSLVREQEEEDDDDDDERCSPADVTMAADKTRQRRRSSAQLQQNGELSVLTSSKPGIKSYRKLPIMSSLVRPLKANNRVGAAPAQGHQQVAPQIKSFGASATAQDAQDSAIASDDSSTAAATGAGSGGLMAMIRGEQPASSTQQQQQQRRTGVESILAVNSSAAIARNVRDSMKTDEYDDDDDLNMIQAAQDAATLSAPLSSAMIRWPEGALPPQHVKKLKWDDEISVVAGNSSELNDCFVAPDICLAGPLSPLSNHEYPIQGTTIDNQEHHYAEQHFIFSHPCSPQPALICSPATSDLQQSGGGGGAGSYLAAAGGGRLVVDEPALANGYPAAVTSMKEQQQQQHINDDQSSIMGQNNCFDYTIVQSSQFHVDAFHHVSASAAAAAAAEQQHQRHQQSLSAQHHHHLLQQQQQQQQQFHPLGLTHKSTNGSRLQQQQPLGNNSYLYSNGGGGGNGFAGSQQHQRLQSHYSAAAANQDLKLMTTAVL